MGKINLTLHNGNFIPVSVMGVGVMGVGVMGVGVMGVGVNGCRCNGTSFLTNILDQFL